MGVVIVDKQCRAVYFNTLCEEIVRRNASLDIVNGRLSLKQPDINRRLTRLVQQADGNEPGTCGPQAESFTDYNLC